jgi:hypothetical protein
MTITALPSLVAPGQTSKLDWSASNVKSCTVTAPNDDSWDVTSSMIGGQVTSPIHTQTIYTFTCRDLQNNTLSKTATVSVVPTFQEQ